MATSDNGAPDEGTFASGLVREAATLFRHYLIPTMRVAAEEAAFEVKVLV